MAYSPTVAEQLPQLLPQSTLASSIPTWANENLISICGSSIGEIITAVRFVDVPPRTISSSHTSGLPKARNKISSIEYSNSCSFEDSKTKHLLVPPGIQRDRISISC